MFDDDLSQQIAETLMAMKYRIVFAESCTAGLISASLARIPGVSDVLAGSAVVYQIPTKCEWLQVAKETVETCGVVSREVSVEMSEGALKCTPHADVAVSVTGHLGPDAPEELDGIAWTSVSLRLPQAVETLSHRISVAQETSTLTDKLEIRRTRQFLVTRDVLRFSLKCLQPR